nr:hypothetical protein [Tanacetum cinerariifolium]
MDDPNITIEEYIRLEEEKARRHGRTFNWQTATYGKMEYCENKDDSFTNLETEYPAIVFDDTSDATLSWEPTVSPLDNNEIDFKLSFDESDDEDYMRLEMILGRAVNRVHVLDFVGLTDGMRQTLANRPSMVYTVDDGHALFTTHARRSERVILDKGDLRDYSMEISSDKGFFGPAPSYVFIQYTMRRLCHRMIAYSISGRGQAPEKYLFRHAEGRKSGARLSDGHFIGRLAAHFRLVSDRGLRSLSVVAKRQHAIMAGAPGATKDPPIADEGSQDVPTPVQDCEELLRALLPSRLESLPR